MQQKPDMTSASKSHSGNISMWLLAGAIVMFGIWICAVLLLLSQSFRGYIHTTFGISISALGDGFGALNSLVSGLALAGVVIGLICQQYALDIQHQAYLETFEANGRSAAALKDQLAEIVRNRKFAAFEHRKRLTLEYLRSNRQVYRKIANQILSGEPITKEAFVEFMSVFEHLATGISCGVYDIEVFDMSAGRMLLDCYSFMKKDGRRWGLAPEIRQRRREAPRRYDQFNALITRLVEMEQSTFVLDSKTITSFQRHPVADETMVAGVRSIASFEGEFPTRLGLAKRLLDHELSQCDHVIYACARRKPVTIRGYAEEIHFDQVVNLFARVAEDTWKIAKDPKSVWPPDLRPFFEDGKLPRDKVVAWFRTIQLSRKCVVIDCGTEAVVGFGGYVRLQALLASPGDAAEKNRWSKERKYWRDVFEKMGERVLAFRQDGKEKSHYTLDGRMQEYAMIEKLAVLPGESRQRGYGRLLLRHLIDEIQALPACKKIAIKAGLTVMKDEEALASARRLYDLEGGELIGVYDSAKDTTRKMEFRVF